VTLEFSRQIFEKYSNINFHENTVEAEIFRAHGRTDMTKLTVALRNFANARKTIGKCGVVTSSASYHWHRQAQ